MQIEKILLKIYVVSQSSGVDSLHAAVPASLPTLAYRNAIPRASVFVAAAYCHSDVAMLEERSSSRPPTPQRLSPTDRFERFAKALLSGPHTSGERIRGRDSSVRDNSTAGELVP
jgi:hypothetical protein